MVRRNKRLFNQLRSKKSNIKKILKSLVCLMELRNFRPTESKPSEAVFLCATQYLSTRHVCS